MLLAIDTSTRHAGVAVADLGRVLSSRCWRSSVNHSAELMPAVDQILRSHGLTPGDLSGIAVALGPGGFSALRVGMSVVKGLAFTSGTAVVGVGTLDLEAYPYLQSGLPVCAILDAGRKEVASALFGKDGVRAREDTVGTVEELVEGIDQDRSWADLAVLRRRKGTGNCWLPRVSWGITWVIRERLGRVRRWEYWIASQICWEQQEQSLACFPLPSYITKGGCWLTLDWFSRQTGVTHPLLFPRMHVGFLKESWTPGPWANWGGPDSWEELACRG